MSKPETITIDDVKYVRADSVQPQAQLKDGMKYIICRTYSAGVFAGYLESRNGQEVVLRNARRLWYVELLNAIELLDCTKKAQDSIASVKVWQA